MTDQPTSASSQESEDSILPLSGLGSDAVDRSRSTSHAPASSNDTGPMSGDGATLLPTPTAGDHKASGSRNLEGSGAHPGTSLMDVFRGDRVSLLPTPNGGNFNDGESTETWRARRDRNLAKGINGNGMGTPLAMEVKLLAESTSSSEDSPASQSAKPDAATPRPTNAGSGRTSPVSFARFNPDGSLSRTYADSSVQASLLGTHYERFSGTWPASGSMRDGVVYEHPTSELHIDGSEYSSLLPTPEAWLARRPSSSAPDPSREASRRHEGKRGQRSRTLPDVIAPLLPTPRTSDTNGTGTHGTGGKDLRTSVGELSNQPSDDGSN